MGIISPQLCSCSIRAEDELGRGEANDQLKLLLVALPKEEQIYATKQFTASVEGLERARILLDRWVAASPRRTDVISTRCTAVLLDNQFLVLIL